MNELYYAFLDLKKILVFVYASVKRKKIFLMNLKELRSGEFLLKPLVWIEINT